MQLRAKLLQQELGKIMDAFLSSVPRWMLGIAATLAAKHPETAGIYQAGPYMIEAAFWLWFLWTLWLGLKHQLGYFRLPASSHTEPYVNAEAEQPGEIFRDPAGKYHRRTFDKYGKEVGTELCDPPDNAREYQRQPAGFFKRA